MASPRPTDAPEVAVAGDLARRAIPVGAVLVLVGAIGWGVNGALSSGFSVALVLANFGVAAGLMAWAARISPNALMGAVLLGYIVRLGAVTVALWAVVDAAWVARFPLFATLLITHVGLLVWETRYVSLSLAYPGLKPTAKPSKEASLP